MRTDNPLLLPGEILHEASVRKNFFVSRPIFAAVISIIIVICGIVSIRSLPIAQYPDIVPPTVVVSANYPGANARTVADTVAAPIEQEINGVENMQYQSSQSTGDGQYSLTVTFAVGTDLDKAQVLVQNRVSLAEPRLPEEVRRLGVSVKKRSPDITLVVQLFSPDKRYDTLYMSNYATLQVRDQLARLPGVGDVFLFGARDYSMRVWLDPQKLAAKNLTAGDVTQAIREQNVQVAAGVIGSPPQKEQTPYQLTINAQGRLQKPEQFEQIVVKTGDGGSIIRLKDVARVELGAKDYAVSAYLNGQEAIAIPIFQLPGTNSINTADAVYAKMKELRASPDWPPGLEYNLPYDTTVFVRQSISDVVKTLVEAVLLVVLVILVFLQNWRAAIIPLVAIPVSLVGTCAVMWAIGFSLNNLSLFGLVLAIGIVVDDAIVVVENVERLVEAGLPPLRAAFQAMHEVTGAVIAIAFGLSAVFIPVAFISGITGQFYKQFALTIAVATLLSAINSLTLSPALAGVLLRPRHGVKRDFLTVILDTLLGWFFKLFNKGLEKFTNGYIAILRRTVRIAVIILLLYGGLLLVTGKLFKAVPTGFIPQQDKLYLVIVVQLPDGASVDRTDAVMKRVAEMGRTVKGTKDCFAVSGFSFLSGTNQSNAGAAFITLNDFDLRAGHPEQSAEAIVGQLYGLYSQIQDGMVLVFPPPAVNGLGNAGGFKLQVLDKGGKATPEELQAATERVVATAMQNPEVTQLFTSFRSSVPQLYVNVDREKAKAQNIAITDVFDTLQTYLGSLYVNDFNFLGRTFQVTAQADAPFRRSAEDIRQLKTRNRAGQMVPLGSVLEVRNDAGPARLGRYNLYTTAEIQGAAAPGVATGRAMEVMEQACKESLPNGFGYEWTELALQEKNEGSSAMWIFPLCVLMVFLVHSAEYESWSLPTAIILIVPMCICAAIAAVWAKGMDNNIFTQIGFVVLAGLSAKNAVLIIEFAKQQEEKGLPPVQAVIEAARLRLRPILMTSFAFILGVLPLLTATGAGFEMRRALGTAVFYGMLGVTFFGIFLTPVFYVSIRWLNKKLGFGGGHCLGVPPGTPGGADELARQEAAKPVLPANG